MRCQFGISRSARRPRFPLPGRPPHPRRPSLSPSGVRRAEEGYRFAGASSGRGNLLRAPAELSRPAVAKAIAAALGRRAEQSRELEWRRSPLSLASRRVQAPRLGRAMPGAARPAPPMAHAGRAVRRRSDRDHPKVGGAGGWREGRSTARPVPSPLARAVPISLSRISCTARDSGKTPRRAALLLLAGVPCSARRLCVLNSPPQVPGGAHAPEGVYITPLCKGSRRGPQRPSGASPRRSPPWAMADNVPRYRPSATLRLSSFRSRGGPELS